MPDDADPGVDRFSKAPEGKHVHDQERRSALRKTGLLLAGMCLTFLLGGYSVNLGDNGTGHMALTLSVIALALNIFLLPLCLWKRNV
jgi:hypothetical protein